MAGLRRDQDRYPVVDDAPTIGKSLSLCELIDEVETEASRVVSQEQWTLAGNVPATRLQIESEAAGEVALLLTVINGRDLVLVGYGDLTQFDEIARTLRPLSAEPMPVPAPVVKGGGLPDPKNAPPFAEYGEFIRTYLAVGGSAESLTERLQGWGASWAAAWCE